MRAPLFHSQRGSVIIFGLICLALAGAAYQYLTSMTKQHRAIVTFLQERQDMEYLVDFVGRTIDCPGDTLTLAGCDQAIAAGLIDPHQDISADGAIINTARGAQYKVRLYCEDCESLYAGCGMRLMLQAESYAGAGGRRYNLRRHTTQDKEWTTVKNGNIVTKCTLE